VKVCCFQAWLFDIVKRVFDVFAPSRGGTGCVCASMRLSFRDLMG